MRLRLRDVLARAAERGYTAEEIRPCLTEDLGNGWYEVDVSSAAYPKAPRPGHEPQMGLGDRVKAGLEKFGITEDRVKAVAGMAGIKDCGCQKRRAKMNELGAKYLGLPPGLPPENTG